MGPFESDPIVCDKSLNSTVLGACGIIGQRQKLGMPNLDSVEFSKCTYDMISVVSKLTPFVLLCVFVGFLWHF